MHRFEKHAQGYPRKYSTTGDGARFVVLATRRTSRSRVFFRPTNSEAIILEDWLNESMGPHEMGEHPCDVPRKPKSEHDHGSTSMQDPRSQVAPMRSTGSSGGSCSSDRKSTSCDHFVRPCVKFPRRRRYEVRAYHGDKDAHVWEIALPARTAS